MENVHDSTKGVSPWVDPLTKPFVLLKMVTHWPARNYSINLLLWIIYEINHTSFDLIYY